MKNKVHINSRSIFISMFDVQITLVWIEKIREWAVFEFENGYQSINYTTIWYYGWRKLQPKLKLKLMNWFYFLHSFMPVIKFIFKLSFPLSRTPESSDVPQPYQDVFCLMSAAATIQFHSFFASAHGISILVILSHRQIQMILLHHVIADCNFVLITKRGKYNTESSSQRQNKTIYSVRWPSISI